MPRRIVPVYTAQLRAGSRRNSMKRLSLFPPALILGLLALVPAPGSAIPTEGCYCPNGSGTTLGQTVWGAAPAYTCADLAAIGSNDAQQYATNHCAYGYCSLTFANQACVDPGASTQHYNQNFTYKCYICIT